MPDLLVPDVSEFQTVDFDVFSGPIIVRAHNSNRADKHWAPHAAGASKQPWWAAYQYLTAGADPAEAARAFLATLGGYRPNCTILDLEEGTGDQQARQHAWLEVMAADPARDWTYSGDYFARAHGLAPEWIAAYQSRAPSAAHRLWQFTDKQNVPGIGLCDASVFLGTVADLVALTSNTPPAPSTEDDMSASCATTDGAKHVFEITAGTINELVYDTTTPHWQGPIAVDGKNITGGLSCSADGERIDLYARVGPDLYHFYRSTPKEAWLPAGGEKLPGSWG